MKNLIFIIVGNLLLQSCAMWEKDDGVPFYDSKIHGKSLKKTSKQSINEYILPSETEDLIKQNGAVYYNRAVKNKVLVPAHFWGEVEKSGLHFIPTETNLVSGLSLAGGPRIDAKMQDVRVKRVVDDKLEEYKFDLSRGGNTEAFKFKIQPGDAVYVRRERFYDDRNLIISLLTLFTTITTGILTLEQIND